MLHMISLRNYTQNDKNLQNTINHPGDLNNGTGRKQHSKVICQCSETAVIDNVTKLITLCEQNKMKITNGFFSKP